MMPSLQTSRRHRLKFVKPSSHSVCTTSSRIWCRVVVLSVSSPNEPKSRVFPPYVIQELTMTLASTSLELLFNTVPTSSTAALEPNKEWVNVMVDGSDHKMTGGAANAKHSSMFVKGASYVVDDATELTVEGSKRISSSPSDVVVALSTREKGDCSIPSSVVDEEVVATPYRV
ncbi:hypothetical protein Tco_0764255 [Tanacetum coccineum]